MSVSDLFVSNNTVGHIIIIHSPEHTTFPQQKRSSSSPPVHSPFPTTRPVTVVTGNRPALSLRRSRWSQPSGVPPSDGAPRDSWDEAPVRCEIATPLLGMVDGQGVTILLIYCDPWKLWRSTIWDYIHIIYNYNMWKKDINIGISADRLLISWDCVECLDVFWW
jgi:hypothetical protein